MSAKIKCGLAACNEMIEIIPNQKPKKFCSDICRQKAHRGKIKDLIKIAIELQGTSVINDLTKPTGLIEPQKQPETNFTIDTRPKEESEMDKLIREMREDKIKNKQ